MNSIELLVKLITTICFCSIIIAFLYSYRHLETESDRIICGYITIVQILGIIVTWYT